MHELQFDLFPFLCFRSFSSVLELVWTGKGFIPDFLKRSWYSAVKHVLDINPNFYVTASRTFHVYERRGQERERRNGSTRSATVLRAWSASTRKSCMLMGHQHGCRATLFILDDILRSGVSRTRFPLRLISKRRERGFSSFAVSAIDRDLSIGRGWLEKSLQHRCFLTLSAHVRMATLINRLTKHYVN